MQRPAFVIAVALSALLASFGAHAINAQYARQLERSGCTQVSEAQGCDITKSRTENARAGFFREAAAAPAPAPAPAAKAATPYAGQWVAKSDSGATVATIRIDARERVWVNGKPVKARRSDGALIFKTGPLSFLIQGDRRLQGEDRWTDHDAGTSGAIVGE